LILLLLLIANHPKLSLHVGLWIARKASQMDHGPLRMVADQCPWVFADSLLNAWGKAAQLCRRQRVITPFRLGLALTATGANPRVETIADVHCGFHAFFGTSRTSQAFDHQGAPPRLADVARPAPERFVGEMPLTVLGLEQGRALTELRPIVSQDGRACAIHDALREVCPGRFKVVQPAAVALPTTMDCLCDAPTTVVLTPDTTNAQAFVPEPASLRGSWLLADRGSLALHALCRGQDAGGFLLIRATAGMHPQVVEALRADGTRLRSLRHTPLQALPAKRPKRQQVDLVVRWQVDEHPLGQRLISRWNRQTRRCCSVVTHLAATRSPLEMTCRVSQWREPGA
jgi:hypothetical protein